MFTPRRLWSTLNGGRSWQSIGEDLASYPWFYNVEETLLNGRRLLAATSQGIYELDLTNTMAVEDDYIALPQALILQRNYPNPFNSTQPFRTSSIAMVELHWPCTTYLGSE